MHCIAGTYAGRSGSLTIFDEIEQVGEQMVRAVLFDGNPYPRLPAVDVLELSATTADHGSGLTLCSSLKAFPALGEQPEKECRRPAAFRITGVDGLTDEHEVCYDHWAFHMQRDLATVRILGKVKHPAWPAEPM